MSKKKSGRAKGRARAKAAKPTALPGRVRVKVGSAFAGEWGTVQSSDAPQRLPLDRLESPEGGGGGS